MATVCGGCLAMLDAGVPLTRAGRRHRDGLDRRAGHARTVAVLSDILGDEDHLGDMDFKVVGTARGITALQLDNKVGGLNRETLERALAQARAGLDHILEEMARTLAEPRAEPSRHAPRVVHTEILPSSVGALVGARGANIKQITAETGARIVVDDDGVVHVYASDGDRAKKALRMVGKSAGVVKRGSYYTGTVTRILDAGAFVKINDVNEGFVGRGELTERGGPPKKPHEILKEGQDVHVRVVGIDDRGRLALSIRAAIEVDPALVEF